MALIALGLVTASAPALAASCNGASHDSTLSAGKAAPGSGVPGTVFKFSVRYADTAGCPASSVVLVIPGLGSSPMVAAGGQPLSGVTYRASRQLPIGAWGYRFEATSGAGQGLRTTELLEVSPTSVTVVAPTPQPTPLPTPQPTPSQTPPPAPDASTSPTTGGAGGGLPPPERSPGANGGLPPRPGSPPVSGGGAGSGQPPKRSPAPPSAASPGTPDVRGVATGLAAGLGRHEGIAPGALPTFGQVFVPASRGTGVPIPILAWLVTTATGVGLYAVMLRRGVGEESSPLAAALAMAALARANRWTGPGAGLAVAGGAAAGGVEGAATPAGVAGAADRVEANRSSGWRFRPPLRFEMEPAAGVERRRITYRLVRLSDEPDDLRSREIMRLDRGDDIDIVGSADRFLQVRTPSGEVGWIPRTAVIG